MVIRKFLFDLVTFKSGLQSLNIHILDFRFQQVLGLKKKKKPGI